MTANGVFSTAYCNIPTEVFKQKKTNMYHNGTISAAFPFNMKYANVNPVHKKGQLF